MSVPATDVGNRLKAREVVGGQDASDRPLRLGLHGGVEDPPGLWVLGQVAPEALRECLGGRRRAGLYGVIHRPEGHPEDGQAEHLGEGAHRLGVVGAQQLRGGGVADRIPL